jgi:bifunctional enzyme CysN/CysC
MHPKNIVICSFMTPTKEAQNMVLDILQDRAYFVYVETSIEECVRRDPKGLYAKEAKGEIAPMCGTGAEFTPPTWADMTIPTEANKDWQCAEDLVERYYHEHIKE